MGAKKKLEDFSIEVLIEIGGKKTMVKFDIEDLFIEATGTIRPLKKNDGDPPGFYEILSERCELRRQIWSRFGEIPPDLSTMIKDMTTSHWYHLLFYYENGEEEIICNDSIQCHLHCSLNVIEPPTIHFHLFFPSFYRNEMAAIPDPCSKYDVHEDQTVFF